MVRRLFDRKNLLVACDPRFGRYLTGTVIYRGDVHSQEAEAAISQIQTRNSGMFVE